MPTPEDFDPSSVPIQPAATVMLVRDGDVGLEVFMLRRTMGAVFARGMYVFPGGRVDAVDGEGDDGFRVAAIRECFEEAGMLLATDGNGNTVRDGHPALARRHDVHDGTISLVDVCAEHGLTLDVDALAWVAHWLTPMGERRRFDTRFYVAPAPAGQTSVHDDTETVASEWVRPAEWIARFDSGDLVLMPPTLASLRFLAESLDSAGAIARGRAVGVPQLIKPRIRFREDGKIDALLMPGDAGYEELPDV